MTNSSPALLQLFGLVVILLLFFFFWFLKFFAFTVFNVPGTICDEIISLLRFIAMTASYAACILRVVMTISF